MRPILLALLTVFCAMQSLSFLDAVPPSAQEDHTGTESPASPQEPLAESEDTLATLEPQAPLDWIGARPALRRRAGLLSDHVLRPFAAFSLCLRL